MVSGIAHYGNCFGVPTVGGECVFEDCYSGNPLVNVFALGVFQARTKSSTARPPASAIPVIYVGAKTGRDGIHGASMASGEFTEESKQKRPNVQVGDPFMEKLLLEACLEAMQTGAIVGIQDMGAAGLTCSTCEMGSRAGTGIEIDLQLRPAARNRHDALRDHALGIAGAHAAGGRKGPRRRSLRVFRKWGLDAVDDRRRHRRRHAARQGSRRGRGRDSQSRLWPMKRRSTTGRTRKPYRPAPYRGARRCRIAARDLQADLITLLASPDICSKRWIWQQYDYTVRTNTLAGPGADAAIVRIKETGTSIAMSLDGNGRYCAARSARRHEADRGRVLPQSVDRRRAAGGRHQ